MRRHYIWLKELPKREENDLPLTYSMSLVKKKNYILNCTDRFIKLWSRRVVYIWFQEVPWEVSNPIPCSKQHQMSSAQVSHSFVHVLKTSKKGRTALVGNQLQYQISSQHFFFLYSVWTALVLAYTCCSLSSSHAPLWKVCLYFLSDLPIGDGGLLLGSPKAVSSAGWTNLAVSASSHGSTGPAPVWRGGSLLD